MATNEAIFKGESFSSWISWSWLIHNFPFDEAAVDYSRHDDEKKR